jgi:hypothetical protein
MQEMLEVIQEAMREGSKKKTKPIFITVSTNLGYKRH